MKIHGLVIIRNVEQYAFSSWNDFTIEPMVNMGGVEIFIDDDNGWKSIQKTESRLHSGKLWY